jgi:hypothetical protein
MNPSRQRRSQLDDSESPSYGEADDRSGRPPTGGLVEERTELATLPVAFQADLPRKTGTQESPAFRAFSSPAQALQGRE